MLKKLKKQLGFTLMETVIVLGIFSIATTYSISIFVQSNTVQKRTANIQRLISDARYVVEVMAREVRMGTIDYTFDQYTLPLDNPENFLAILDEDNQPVRFRRFEVEVGRWAVQICLGNDIFCNNDNNWQDITPDDLTVERLDFYISPAKDPFSWQDDILGYWFDQQPIVTIVLETKSLLGSNSVEQHISHFQTTVSSRSYKR